MKISIHGTRGFVPVPGDTTLKYGGNTICTSITTEGGSLIAIDGGTGLAAWSRTLLGGELGRGLGEVSIIFTHSHYDHTQGFLFFIPALIPRNLIHIYGPNMDNKNFKEILEDQVIPLFSPMQTLDNFASTMEFQGISKSTELKIDEITFNFQEFPHETGTTIGITFSDNHTKIGYLGDVLHSKKSIKQSINFFKDCDVLIHDSTVHSPGLSLDYINSARDCLSDGIEAVEIAHNAKINKLLLIHYHHSMDDTQLDRMLSICRKHSLNLNNNSLDIDLAREGMTLFFT